MEWFNEFRLILHLLSWAQLGVLTRVYLEQVFGAACSPTGKWNWIPCVTSSGNTRYGGALFTSLPANMVGSFIMGTLSASETLAAVYRTPSWKGVPMAIFPKGSSLQSYTPLLMGLRTGYCGSLTTLSSWFLQMIQMLVSSASSSPLGTQWVEALSGCIIGTILALGCLVAGQQLSLYIFSKLNPDLFTETGQAKEGPGKQPEQAVVTIKNEPVDSATATAAASSPILPWLADAFAVVNLFVLSGVSIGMLAKNQEGALDFSWFAILLGPSGCLLRWQLAKLNGALSGSASWFPLGTFLANIIACVLDYGVAIISLHVQDLTHVQSAVLKGVISGVGGCLSTVSTWVVEVQKLSLTLPHNARGYQYIFATFVTAGAFGILMYGTALWVL